MQFWLKKKKKAFIKNEATDKLEKYKENSIYLTEQGELVIW